jgi:hypothetical protein
MEWIFGAFLIASVLHMGEEYFYPGGFMDIMKRINPKFAPLVTAPIPVIINGLQLLLCNCGNCSWEKCSCFQYVGSGSSLDQWDDAYHRMYQNERICARCNYRDSAVYPALRIRLSLLYQFRSTNSAWSNCYWCIGFIVSCSSDKLLRVGQRDETSIEGRSYNLKKCIELFSEQKAG